MAGWTLYNAGDRIKESIKFTTRTSKEDFKQYNWMASYLVDAPEAGFFDLPEVIVTPPSQAGPGGRVQVNFGVDMARKHGHKGLVCIDPTLATSVEDDEPFAATKEEAVTKAKRLWTKHLQRTVEEHLMACAAARSLGAAPHAASHFTARAFQLLRVVDPGALVFETRQQEYDKTKASADAKDKADTNQELSALREQMAELLRKVSLSDKKAEAETKARKEADQQERILAKQQQEK